MKIYVMSQLLDYPQFSAIDMDMFQEVTQFCRSLDSGISEFSFSNIYLDSKKYQYTLSRLSPDSLILAGVSPARDFEGMNLGGRFFSIMGETPRLEVVEELFGQGYYWKNMSHQIYTQLASELEEKGCRIFEDRDNFDYLYRRTDLANLQGKSFHKKKNLVNAFTSNYASEVKPLDVYTLPAARVVLESWRKGRPEDEPGDYNQCLWALENFQTLGFSGVLVLADGVPVGFSLGEFIQGGTMFVVLYEKGINGYKGVYQFVNRAQALNLPPTVELINREQDLGNEGLRQAKMTYRPIDFTKKYLVVPAGR